MFKLLKIFKKPIKVIFGKVNLKPTEKVKTQVINNNKLGITKLNNKTHYYTKQFVEENVAPNGVPYAYNLHLSVSAKQVIKKYPELINFLKEHLITKFTDKQASFENNSIKLNLLPFKPGSGSNHSIVYSLDVVYKKENITQKYFVKISSGNFSTDQEFIANKIFEKFGINTIKPHFAYSDNSSREFIIYDFTNLHSLEYAEKHKIITSSEFNSIIKKVDKLYKYKKEIGLGDYKTKGIGDYDRPSNIYVERINNKINIYFSDLLIGKRSFSY